jgi:hypothetical protein
MIITLTETGFINKFLKIRPNNFSIEGLKALYNYFEEIDEGMEFDPIGICTEYTEYESLNEFYSTYDSYNKVYNKVEHIQDLSEYTQVIQIDDYSFIIADF